MQQLNNPSVEALVTNDSNLGDANLNEALAESLTDDLPDCFNKGFLLTRKAQDRNNTIVITLWLKTNKGAVELIIENQQVLFFIEQQHTNAVKALLQQRNIQLANIAVLPLKTFNQQPVSACYFNTMHDFYLARDCLKANNIKCYEDDFRPDDRYLMERFITAGIQYDGEPKAQSHTKAQPSNHLLSTSKASYNSFSQARCKPSEVAIDLSMLSIDIECSMAGDLYSIGFYSNDYQKVLMIGNSQPCEEAFIEWVDNEVALLLQFISLIQEVDPDIIIGWNVINFDMNLLQKRCDLHGIAFAIGRDKSKVYWRQNKNSDQKYIEISGRVVLDGIDLLKTATYSFPSFSLDNVANTLLGIGKKVDDVDNRIEEITDNFTNNKPALAAYNLEDCRLVWLIFEHTQLLEFAMLRAQLTGLAIDRVGGSAAAFTNLYLPKLHRSGYIAPNMGDGASELVSPGGYVMDSIPGLYENVLVLDFKSLYPSIIRTFKIDPMGLIDGLLEHQSYQSDEKVDCTELPLDKQPIIGFDGAYFSRDNHFLPGIIKSLWLERDIAKKDKNAALSQAIKIIMNSFYGILGSTGCRFFDPRLAGSITKRSHALLKTTKSWIEQRGFTVIYGDTDSIFVHVGKEKSLDESRALGAELALFINKKMTAALKEQFAVTSELEIEFETHFSKFLMPTIRGLDIGTKKRYAGMVVNVDESTKQTQQQMIFKGLETVRTDWTELAKEFQQALYQKVFNDLPTRDYIKDFVARTLSGEFDSKLIYRKRIRRKLKDYIKNVPPHVKAARIADMLNQEQGKPLKYQNKGWIEYYMTLNGPQAKEHLSAPLDYQLYIDRQLATIADGILPFVGSSFSNITDTQLSLFD